MTIPKIIHYCWFGGNEIPSKGQACIDSWSKVLPDYKIILWDENSFDFSVSKFCKQAYQSKNYAFVSDYVRAFVLNKYGGIYLDTDVELFNSFSRILADNDTGFMGFERKAFIGTAVIACLPENKVIKKLLSYYDSRDFLNKNGEINIIANTSILADILVEKGLVLGGKKQQVCEMTIYNREVFYPKKLEDNSFKITEETTAVHRFSNSWLTDKERKRGTNKVWINICRPILRNLRGQLVKILGKTKTEQIEITIRNKMR
jgi:mannosyltransferase OCH1-like enzyme